jgi:hypothetical protein
MWFATPFIIGLFHPLHLAGFDRRTETIAQNGASAIETSAAPEGLQLLEIPSRGRFQ